jgi:hypothetical protein
MPYIADISGIINAYEQAAEALNQNNAKDYSNYNNHFLLKFGLHQEMTL